MVTGARQDCSFPPILNGTIYALTIRGTYVACSSIMDSLSQGSPRIHMWAAWARNEVCAIASPEGDNLLLLLRGEPVRFAPVCHAHWRIHDFASFDLIGQDCCVNFVH